MAKETRKVQVFLDLGNSETRCVVRAGLNEGDKRVHYAFSTSNSFALVRDEEQLKEALRGDYNNETSSAFKLNLGDKVKNLKGIHVSGELAERNYEKIMKASTGQKPKYEQYKVYLAMIKAIDKSLVWLTKFSKSGKLTKSEVANEKVELELIVLVPPKQVTKAEEKFQEVFLNQGVSYIDVFTSEEITLNVTRVKVLSEGLTAYLASVFSYSNLKLRPIANELSSKRVLILDIGAGTTDLIAIDKGEVMDLVKTTIPTGGNDIVTLTRTKFNDANSSDLSNVIFKDVLVFPEIMWGDTVVDVTKYVELATGDVADLILANVRDFFTSQNTDISTFNSLLIIGGGALSNGLTQGISEIIYEGLEEDLPEISLINTKSIKEPELDGSELKLDTLRTLNLLGALVWQSIQDRKAKS